MADSRIALRKLQSGQALTDDEKRDLGLPVTAPEELGYVEEFPDGMPDIAGYLKAIDTGLLPPGILKPGFTEGPLPTEYQKLLGNPDILGWRLVTDENGTQRIEVQTGAGTTQTYGAAVGGNKPPSGGNTGSNTNASDKYLTDFYAKQAAENALKERQSAYDLLYNQFKQYGLESLVEGIKDLIKSNISPSEFSIRLQDTDAYKKRFAANQDRIKAGLKALTPAEYIGLEDQYQNIMRNYGLPASYYTKDAMGTQAGFNKFIANDVSAAELEDRIATAQKRVINADVNVTNALKQFYPDITNADILAYTLDPTNALENIKRKVTAAEIGGAALGQNLMTSAGRAEELAKYGVTKAQAQQGFQTIGEFLPTAEKLGDIYANQGLGAYDQAVAEAEVFGTAGAAEAAKKRKKLSQLEQAQFGGQAGTTQGALGRERAGAF
jgi:hypothetical protein